MTQQPPPGPAVPGPGLSEVDWDAMLLQAMTGVGLASHYQPIVETTRGDVVGYEALARFSGYPVSNPETWFVEARRRGAGARLEGLALRAAFMARPTLPADTFLTVNVDPMVLDEPEVREVWEEQGALGGVVVELTEHTQIDSYAALEPALDRLRSAGAMIAIDDTGSGYAGLRHLLAVRPHFIKLDRDLVAGVDRDERKRALIDMLGVFASRVDAWVVAEGVETAAELDTVTRLGVPLVQGYHLARPGPPWSVPTKATRDRLASHAVAAVDGASLRRLLEPAVTVGQQDHADPFLTDDGVDLVVVLDADGRPHATLHADGAVPLSRPAGMRVAVDTDIVEATHRALTRPPEQRFHPLLCTDPAGRFVGVVRMERLVSHLAGRAGASD